MVSAVEKQAEVSEKLNKEIQMGRIMGPFDTPPISNLRCSPIGAVPKKQGGWRLICNLSAPEGKSVNDFIDPDSCSVSYSSFDDAIQLVQQLGPNALLGKMDISNAFRLLPVRPEDFCLLGFTFQDKYYIDKCLPMGCSISCALFEKFSTFLHWALEQKSQMTDLIHYLDDFLFAGKQNTHNCQQIMNHFESLCQELGVPLSREKTEGPTTCLSFLGLGINTATQTIFIPEDKIFALSHAIKQLIGRKKATLKELQSLLGSLAFVVKALPAGRAFCRRVYATIAGLNKPHHIVRISKEIKYDLEMWLTFLGRFNGTTPFPSAHWEENETLQFFSDSSGAHGGGVIFGKVWAYIFWPESWSVETRKDITFLELVPIVLGLSIWAHSLQTKKVLLHIDNLALVHIINQKTSKNPRVMALLRSLVLIALQYNIQLRSTHVPGSKNEISDAISRFQWERFRRLAPWANPYPCQVPTEFWSLLQTMQLD